MHRDRQSKTRDYRRANALSPLKDWRNPADADHGLRMSKHDFQRVIMGEQLELLEPQEIFDTSATRALIEEERAKQHGIQHCYRVMVDLTSRCGYDGPSIIFLPERYTLEQVYKIMDQCFGVDPNYACEMCGQGTSISLDWHDIDVYMDGWYDVEVHLS